MANFNANLDPMGEKQLGRKEKNDTNSYQGFMEKRSTWLEIATLKAESLETLYALC